MLTKPTHLSAFFKKNETGCKLVNGTRLYYEIRGEGQPLVFIHDFALDRRMWDDQFYYFSKWYQCIRFDMRGYGQSALPGSQYYSFHNDLKSLLESLQVYEPVILVGLSMGGLVAIDFALQFPAFTKAIVLAGTQIDGYPYKNFGLDHLFVKAKRKSIEYAKRKWFAHESFAHARKNKPVSESIWQMIRSYSGWHLVDKPTLSIEDPNAWDNLENVKAPALIICGELDLPDFKEISDAAAFRIPGAKKVILANTGHISNMENPGAFNKELQIFLSALPSG
jgi:pimeloyl-ACP methyl ester carboxylesterase